MLSIDIQRMLTDIFCPDAFIRTNVHPLGFNYVDIREKSPEATCKLLKVVGLEKGHVALCLDVSDIFSYYFNVHNDHINKSCDAVIFYYNNEKLYVMLFELKSRRDHSACQQLLNSKFFVDYIMDMARHYYDIKDIVVEYRFFIAKKMPARKRPLNNSISHRRFGFDGYMATVVPCSDNLNVKEFINYVELWTESTAWA